MIRLVYISFLWVLLLSCYSLQKKPVCILEKPDTIISLERTACYGECPIYKIEVFSDGSGQFTGTRFIEKIGISNFQLTAKEIDSIVNYATKIGFNNMNDEYTERISDLPTTFVKIKKKKIRDYVGGPKELKELESLIDTICLKKVM